MNKRLENYNSDDRKQRSAIKAQVLEMQFGDDEATKRVVMHSAKRVIQQHKAELQELAYK
jgi:5-carboxymethyl-2-hydroxymuconate isomerase